MKPLQPPPFPRANFLSLPIEIRLKIYKEIIVPRRPRWHIYKYFPSIDRGAWVVKHQGGTLDTHLRCYYTYKKSPNFLALVYTSWQIYTEAKAVFLSENTFQICEESATIPQDLTLGAFTDRIGENNARLLRRIDMHFPLAEKTPAGKLEFRADSLKTLHLLQSRCTGLTNLRFYNRWESETFFDIYHEDPASTLAILSEVNRIIRGIASLKTVTVYTKTSFKDPHLKQDPQLKEFIRNLGWIFNPLH
jgi:hypothetical protein